MKLTENQKIVQNGSLKIESRFRQLAIVATYTPDGAPPALTAALASNANATVTIEKQTNKGTTVLLNKVPLAFVLEMANNEDSSTAMNGNELTFTIALSPYGYLQTATNEFYKVKFENFADTFELDVFAMDAPVYSDNIHNTVDVIGVLANVPKEVNVIDATFVGIPVTTEKVDIVYNGIVNTFENEELRSMCSQTNEVSAIDNGKVLRGALTHFYVNVADAISVKIQNSTDTSVYVVTEKQIN